MKRHELSLAARSDFYESYEYLAQRNLTAAYQWEDDILKALDQICEFPHAAPIRPDLTSLPLRVATVGSYLIVYSAETDPIAIVAILHGARDAHAILNNRLR